MAKTDPKVMSLVENELEKNPDASVEELYEKAKSKEPSVSELTHRQFHARYPLQVKRRRSAKSGGRSTTQRRSKRGGKRAAAGNERERVRKVLVQLATDLTSSSDTGQVVKVVAGLDRYVDQVLKAVR